MAQANPEPKGAAALKVGIGLYMLCRFQEALASLSAATDNKDRRYFQAQCYKSLGQYAKAVEEFERAADRGWEFEKIPGDMSLLQRLLDGPWANEDFLTVHPGQKVAVRYDDDVIAAVPAEDTPKVNPGP